MLKPEVFPCTNLHNSLKIGQIKMICNKKMQHSCGVTHSIALIIISVPKYKYFGKPISIRPTLNIILYEVIKSRVYGHNIKL